MSVRPRGLDPMMTAAVVASALIGAQYIAGKAARDALFLAAFDASMLPRMIIGTALFSITLVVASGWLLRRVQPSAWVPAAFALSALLLFGEWSLTNAGPGVAASLLYLQVSGLGPVLGSGFWLMASERFDPRSARRLFGMIAGAGTVGGLLGGLGTARIVSATSVETPLPVLAVMNAICAWQVWSIGRHPLPAPRV
jgi:AAA family ATP:ADP antiporter